MKIKFNELGAIIETITNDEPLTQGSRGVTLVATFEGKKNYDYLATLNFKRADGEVIADIPMTPSKTALTDYYLKFEPAYFFAVDGETEISIFLRKGSGEIVASGVFTFGIERTLYNDAKVCFTREQFDEIMALIQTKMPNYDDAIKLKLGEELPRPGKLNTMYFVPIGDTEVYDRYWWNEAIQDYVYFSSTRIDLNQYIKKLEKGEPNGVAPLDEHNHVPLKHLPGSHAARVYGKYISETEFQVNGVAVEGKADTLYIDNDTNITYGFNPESKKFYVDSEGTINAQNVSFDKNVTDLLKANNVQVALDELSVNKLDYIDYIDSDELSSQLLVEIMKEPDKYKDSVIYFYFNSIDSHLPNTIGGAIGLFHGTSTSGSLTILTADFVVTFYTDIKSGNEIKTRVLSRASGIDYKNTDSELIATDVQKAIDELATKKINTAPLQWLTLPVDAVDKKTFYNKTISTLRTANSKIYMYGTPEETPIKEFFEIWGKPNDFKATHVYITIASVSNTAGRDSFIMIIHSSNYSNMYFYIVNGYSSQLVGNGSGWVSANLLSAERQKLLLPVGFYDETATVGNSLGLINPNPTKPINGEFITRTTANGQGVYKGQAKVQVIGGNTIKVNQLATPTDTTDERQGVKMTLVEGGVAINGTSTGQDIFAISMSNINVIANHKYLVNCFTNSKGSSSTIFCYITGATGDFDYGNGAIASASSSTSNNYFICKFRAGQTFNNVILKPRLTDLTAIFGAGNEPASVDDEHIKEIMDVLNVHPEQTDGTLYNAQPTLLTSKNEQGEFIDELKVDSAKYFPSGMNGIGNVRDIITKNKATQNLKEIKLIELTWRFEYGRFISNIHDIKLPVDAEHKSIMKNDLYYDYTWNDFLNTDNAICMRPDFDELAIRDSSLNGDLVAFKDKIKNSKLVYELATPVITLIDEPLDLAYNVENQGIETWDTEVPVYLSAIYLKDLVFDLAEQPKKNKEFDTRITALENKETNLENNVVKLDPQELTSEQQAQVKENLGLTTDAVPLATYATGAGGLVQQDATLLLQNYDNYEGHLIEFFANEEMPVKLVSVGYVMKTLSNEPVLIELDRDGSIIKWTTTTNYRVGGEIIRGLNYTKTNKTYHVKLMTNQVALMKELIVGVEFYFNVNGENILHYVKDRIEFPEPGESNAVVYLGKTMPSPNALSEDIALTYNKNTGDLKVSAAKESTLIPDTFKITSVKGVLR